MPTLRITIFLFFLQWSSTLWSVDNPTWKKADSLLKAKDYKAAFILSENIIKKDPLDTFGWWLRLQSSSQLSATKGKWPQECLDSAKELAKLEPNNEDVHLTTAIWCLKNDSRHSEIIAFIPKVIPSVRSKIGDNNYALLINTLSITYIKLGDKSKAREIFNLGLDELNGTESAIHTAYNLGELFHDESMTYKERMKWHELFSKNLFIHKLDNPLIPSISWNTMILTDLQFKEKNYNEAMKTISMVYPEMDKHISNHWNYLRDQIYIRYLALKFKTKRMKQLPEKNLKMVYLIIPRTRLKNKLPDPLTKHETLDADLNEKDVSDLLFSFDYFSNSFEELTKGIHWDLEVIQTDLEIQSTNFSDESFRYIMQPERSSIFPELSEEILNKLQNADGVVIVWPGTKQPDGVLITNGGGTEWNYGSEQDPQIRLTIISDSNKNKIDKNFANHPIFLYHEMFHVMEWAYHKSKFPKENHPYTRRKEWPKDYEGNTELDFYIETISKRMIKEDNLNRIYWKGRKEGFYGILVKENAK